MGGSQASKLIQNSKLMDTEAIDNLSYLEDGQFAKIYKGHLVLNKQPVTIKVPRVIGDIRKEKKLVKTHIEEVKKLMPSIKRAKSEFIVRYLGVSYDDFRKEVWVVREFVDGADLEALMKNPSLSPALKCVEKRILLAVGICKGMSYLHSNKMGFLHGDFKPSDVLVPAKSLQPKITNFGLWDFKNFFIENAQPELDHISMFNPYQPPEVFVGDERPTLFSDVWSLASVLLQWLLESPIWDFQELCSRYKYRDNKQVLALREAMNNQEEPSVLHRINDEENSEFLFFLDAFNYNPTDRMNALAIEEKLSMVCRTPTWTNLAYNKYYGNSTVKSLV